MPSTPKPPARSATAAGADVGATLVKLAYREPGGAISTEALPVDDLGGVATRLAVVAPGCVGLTGGGAPRLAALMEALPVTVGEFDAWAAGARTLLAADDEAESRFLLVSVGTGTSVMLVEPERVTRVGGTALGGGTIVGLGAALTGASDFRAIAALAAGGDRRRVDLLISDIYPQGDFPLPGDVNAASFAKLARAGGAPADPADLACAVMGLVGENVALICCGLAARAGVERIAFGGSTLRENPALVAILRGACRALGRSPHLLDEGPFVGALGALVLGGESSLRARG